VAPHALGRSHTYFGCEPVRLRRFGRNARGKPRGGVAFLPVLRLIDFG